MKFLKYLLVVIVFLLIVSGLIFMGSKLIFNNEKEEEVQKKVISMYRVEDYMPTQPCAWKYNESGEFEKIMVTEDIYKGDNSVYVSIRGIETNKSKQISNLRHEFDYIYKVNQGSIVRNKNGETTMDDFNNVVILKSPLIQDNMWKETWLDSENNQYKMSSKISQIVDDGRLLVVESVSEDKGIKVERTIEKGKGVVSYKMLMGSDTYDVKNSYALNSLNEISYMGFENHMAYVGEKESKKQIASAEQPKKAEAKKPAEQPKKVEAKKPVEQPKKAEVQKPVEKPKKVEAKKPVEQPKKAEAKKPAEQPKKVEAKKLVEQPKKVEAKKPVEKPKKVEAKKPTKKIKTAVKNADGVVEITKPNKGNSKKPNKNNTKKSVKNKTVVSNNMNKVDSNKENKKINPNELLTNEQIPNEIRSSMIAAVRTFNQNWVALINDGSMEVINNVVDGSHARKMIDVYKKRDMKERFLVMEFGDVSVKGNVGKVHVHEEIEITKKGKTTISKYNWIYEVKKINGKWLISGYSKDKK